MWDNTNGKMIFSRGVSQMEENPINQEEVKNLLEKGKSAGIDNILEEFIKEGGERLLQEIYNLFNMIWQPRMRLNISA